MEKETASRLRVYALIYRLEDELLKVRRREGESSSMALMRMMRVAYPIGYLAKQFESIAAIFEKSSQELAQTSERTANVFKALEIAVQREVCTSKHPERGFTGYCGNRSKYGPRTPKRR